MNTMQRQRPTNYFSLIVILTATILVTVILDGRGSGTVKETRNQSQTARTPVAQIDVSQTSVPIPEHLYGKFTELLGNMFEKGVWAEMLSDRKFFYPVNSSEELIPPNTKRNFERWRPVGPDSFVSMTMERAYVGEHSPEVRLEASTLHGIRQAGLPLQKGKVYVGHIVLAGDTGAHVSVSLVWGTDAAARQSIEMGPLSDEYSTTSLRFTSDGDNPDGRLEITGTGTGSFRIGAVSLMPADNINGFRSDIIARLERLDAGTIYRWPGGNMVSAYDWRDGVGNRDLRPPRYELAWNTVESNDVGTDEFITLCRLLDLDPFICVNAGLQDEYSAAAWVEYANGAANTPMGKLRAAGGHPEPYHVKYWGVGNEMYGQWQWGHMAIRHFVVKHNRFAVAMRKVDPTIKIVASGATPFETGMTARHHRKPLPARLPYKYGTPEDWSGNLLQHSSDYFDVLSEHSYPSIQSAFDEEQQQLVETKDPVVDQVRRVPNRIHAAVEAWHEYLKRMPELKDKHITIALDEWASGGWSRPMVTMLGAAEGLNELIRHTDIFSMSCYTGFTSCIRFNGYATTYSPTGLAFVLYREHFGTIPVRVGGNSPQHAVKGTIGVDRASVPSGSATYPLDVTAALTPDRKTLAVAIVNPTDSPQDMGLEFTNAGAVTQARLRQIAGADYTSRNLPGQDPVVEIRQIPVDGVPSEVTVPPISLSMYEFELR